MIKYKYGNTDASIVLVQMVDDHDLSVIENEAAKIRELSSQDFCLIALKVDDWNRDLSPWEAPAAFGDAVFDGCARDTLEKTLQIQEMKEEGKKFYIGGYSLAGLFALWAAYQTDMFAGTAAASPSIWYPGFTDFMKTHHIRTVFCKSKIPKIAAKNGELCISILEKVAGWPARSLGHCWSSTADMLIS